MNNIGYFITFEGPEGSGKTTQINMLKNYLETKNHKVLVTREPGGTVPGDKIRSVMLENGSGKLEPETELFLMLAQRVEHLKKVIKPAIKNEITVLCDRYYDSSMAYQGYAREIGLKKVEMVHKNFLEDFLPDVTILIQISPEKGLQRATHGGSKSHDRMESETINFHRRVFEGYEQLAQNEPQRFLKVYSEGSAEEIFDMIVSNLNNKIEL